MRCVEGKVALITGGASGIGLGMARVFTGAAMKVVIADLRRDRLDAALQQLPSGSAHAICVDVTDRDAMARAATEVLAVFGKLHVLCNNAGVNLFNDMADATYEDWDWVLGVNLGGVVNGIKAFLPAIKEHGEGGHIVNTASMSAFISSSVAGIYTTSKFAVRGLSEALRWSLAPHRIGVSVLCPGLVDSMIYDSERSRPANLANTSSADAGLVSRVAAVQKLGMSPVEVGEKVLQAILHNSPYIFTHSEFKDELKTLAEEVLAALPDEPVPPARLAFENNRRRRGAEAKAAMALQVE